MNRIYPILAAVVLAVFPGCGREYHIRGRVIILENPAKSGSITEITGKAVPEGGRSLSKATVTVFYQLKDDGSPVETSSWHRSVETDEKGIFDLKDYSIPSMKLKVGLRVHRLGYETVYTTYWDYKEIEPQVFFVEMKQEASK